MTLLSSSRWRLTAMAQLRAPVSLLLSSVALLILITAPSTTQANVCYGSVTTQGSYVVYNQQPQYSQYSYTVSCGWFGWRRCTRYGSSLSYSQGSQTLYNVQYQLTSMCCAGYIGSPPNCPPHCPQACHQGTCTSPSVCSCNAGWMGNSCSEDINECGTNNGGCDHTCTNTEGSFTCSCNTGFVLAANGLTCNDVDECAANTDGCEQSCTNTIGSYQCSCGTGYTLDSDGHTCNDINECTLGTNNCNQVCHNTIGSYYCSCYAGFHLLNHPHICTDVDECSDGSLHMCTQHCNNTLGSHFCDCYVGYELQDDGLTCTDIDECALGISGCDHNCTNNIGSFQCSCLTGYMLINERNCIDIDECNTNNGGCDHVCINQIGSYECKCRDGYTLGEDLHECTADPCPTLSDPLNGAIMCTGPQVTDQSCSYTCQNGYNLTGSVTRTCQPDHTWSGDPTSCPPLQCIELLGQNHAFVVAPCGRDFNTSCNVLCETGFYINGSTSWRQVCQLNNDLGVEWSDPPVCIELTPCQVNPCLNDGTCIATDNGMEQCECTTLFHGSECQVGLVGVPPIPVVTIGAPPVSLTVQGSTDEGILDLFLLIISNSFNSPLTFEVNDNILSVTPASGGSITFTMNAHQQGLYRFRYLPSGSATESTIYNVFEESIVTVVGDRRPDNRPEYAYFTQGGLDRGQLGAGCCHYNYQLAGSICSSSLQFISSCGWQGGVTTAGALTNGVVFVKNSDINLPLSIAGAQISSFGSKFDFNIPVNEGGQISTCSECNDCSNCQTGNTSVCYGLDRDVLFDEYDISDMLREQSLFDTFLTQTSNLLPSWLSASITSPTTTYSQYDYHASILQAIDAKSHPGCTQLTLENSGLLYVLKTRNSLSLNIAGQVKSLNPAELSPLCFAVDVCSGSESTLEVDIKDKFSLSSINYFSSLSGLDWSFDPYTVSFTDLGVTTAISDPMFWNGQAFIAAKLPSYDFKLQVAINGGLTGGNLMVQHSFMGSLLHRAITREDEVPGQLLGHGSVDLAIQYGNNRDVLYLKLSGQPAIFAYPGTTSAASSAVESGISYQLSYQLVPRQDAVFFSELFAIPDYTQSCPVKLYVRLNDNLGIDWANFRTTCLGIRIGMLEFLSNLEHTVTFPSTNSAATGSTSSRLYINSTLSTSSLQLGNFFTLLSQGSGISSIYLAFPDSSSSPLTATLYNTNVTVFDNVLNTQVTVEDTNVEFNGQTTIFGSYQTTLKGITSTNTRWNSLPLRYEGTIDGDYRLELNTYLTNYIQDEVNDWKTRRKNAQNSLNNAEEQLFSISLKNASKSEELSAANAELETLMNTASSLNAQATQAEQTYQQALAANAAAQQATMNVNCNEQTACPSVCQPGVSCTTCYQETQLVEQGSCIKYKGVSKILQLKKPVSTIMWGYQRICNPCFGFARFGFFCFASLIQCCRTECVSMVRYKFEHYTATGYEVISENEPCVVNTINTNAPSQCCMQYPCAYTVIDPACVASNQQCEEQKQAALGALGSAGAALSASYATYTQLKADVLAAELQVSSKQAEIAGIQQEVNIISSARVSAQIGYNISLTEFNAVYEQTESLTPLVQLVDTYGAGQLLEIQSLSYNVTVTTQTPVAFPVLITYNKPYAGQSDQITIVINFDAPKLLTMRSLAEDLVSQFTEGGSRRKRQSEGAANLLITTFQRSCTDLMNLQEYFDQLSQAVNRTQNQAVMATSVIFEVTAITGVVFSSYNSSGNVSSMAMGALQNLSAQRDESSFLEWQTNIAELHNSTTSVGGYDCYGFTDCLHTALSILQRILTDTPTSEAGELLTVLRSIREDVEDLAVFKNLTIEDAEIRLQEVIMIINKTDELDYWCAGLPEFTTQPPGEVNISVSETLRLVTTVESELPIRYRWKRNGILLSGHHTSTLTLPNIQMIDAGQYECLATTDKGTVSSLYSIVNVYYAPIFNLTITPAIVREGEENGVNFACDAHSWPPPGWSWYFRPNSSVAWQLIEGVDANVIPLLSPRLNQEGWYRCQASNWIGEGYREAFLTVLPALVVRINYPVNFKLLETDEVVPVDGNSTKEMPSSGSGTMATGPMFRDSLNHSLTVQLSLITTRVEDVVWTMNSDMELDLNFNLLTPYFVFDNFAEMSVESVLLLAGPSMMNLEADKSRLESVMQESGLHVDHDSTRYRTINDTLRFGTRAFICPAGYGLDPSLVICVSCAPGTYNGAPRIAMTDVGEGQVIQEEMPQCVECPVGTYQQGKGSNECTQCPQYTSTRSAGARNSDACIDFCQVGYFSSSGLEPCQPCPPDYYQLRRGATDCLPCTNTTSEDVCPRPTPTPTEGEPEGGTDINIIIIAASSAAGGLVVLIVLVIVIIAAITLWRRKVKYNVDKSGRNLIGNIAYNTDTSNPYAADFPKEGKKKTKHLKFHDTNKRFSMGAADVDPLSQLNTHPVDIGEPLGEVPEPEPEEEEHNIDLYDQPEIMELDQENKPICY